MMSSLAGLALLLISSSGFPMQPDPLFSMMQGEWTAKGTRTQIVSGRKIQLEAEVSSTIDQQSRLISRTLWTETSEIEGMPGTFRSYELAYWIRADKNRPGYYELGMVDPSDPEAEERVTASGALSEEGFTVVQELPSNPPLRVHSFTRFLINDAGEKYSKTVEAVFIGGRRISEAVIHYVRR